MSEIINLNKARKRREMAAKKAGAAANVRRFGRNKSEKAKDEDARERGAHRLDGLRIFRPDPDPDPDPKSD